MNSLFVHVTFSNYQSYLKNDFYVNTVFGIKKDELKIKAVEYTGHNNVILTQQHAETVICIVFLPGWHTSFRYNGLCDVLFSPLSIISGVALTET